MGREAHTHLFRVPEPLESCLRGIDELAAVVGPGGAAEVERVRAILGQALAAQARGDALGAVDGIRRAMQAIAVLAARLDPTEAAEMSRVAEEFGRALLRGDAAQARGLAEAMRERSGARVVKKDG